MDVLSTYQCLRFAETTPRSGPNAPGSGTGLCRTSENSVKTMFAVSLCAGRDIREALVRLPADHGPLWRPSLELFARSVPLQYYSPAQRRNATQTVLCFGTCMDSLYRAYAARCILIQGSINCGQFCLLKTSLPGLWRFPRMLLCSFPYIDFGELHFHALWGIIRPRI